MLLLIGYYGGELLQLQQMGSEFAAGMRFISRTDRIRRSRLRERVVSSGPEMMPKHISMIMDGNRRFAWGRSLQTEAGHSAENRN